MKSSMGLLWLGTRLAIQRDHLTLTRQALTFLGVLVGTLVVLTGAALPGALQARDAREVALNPRLVTQPVDTGVYALDPEATSSRPWQGKSIRRLAVATDPDSAGGLRIPGLNRIPGEGEAFLSPRLRELAMTNATIARLLSAYRTVGTIDDEGLASPRELRAVLGVPRDTQGLQAVASFGSDPRDPRTVAYMKRLNSIIGFLVCIVVLAPTTGLVVTATRLGTRQKRGRVNALRRLGLSRSHTRFAMALETIWIVTPALVIAVLAHSVGAEAVFTLPFMPADFFPTDLASSWAETTVATSGLLLLAAMSAAFAVNSDATRAAPPTRPNSRRPRHGPKALTTAAATALLLLMTVPFLPDGLPKATALLSAIVALSFVAVTGGDPAVRRVAATLARASRSGGGLVGLRIAQNEPGTTTRACAAFTGLLVTMAAAVSFLTILGAGTDDDAPPDATVTVTVNDFFRMLTPTAVATTPGVADSVALREVARGQDTVFVAWGACETVSELAQATTPCPTRSAWMTGPGQPAPASEAVPLTFRSETIAAPASDADPWRTGSSASPFAGALFVPNTRGVSAPPTSGTYVITVPDDRLSLVLARLSSLSPAATFDYRGSLSSDPRAGEYDSQIRWLLVGIGAALLVTALALAIGALGETESRRNRLRGLYLLGTRRRDLATCHVASIFVPVVVTLMTGACAALAASLTVRAFDSRATLSLTYVATSFAVVIAVAVMVTLVTLPTSLRPWKQGD